MSLINDALKRASITKTAALADGNVAVPMQPVEQTTPKSGALPMILCITGIGALLVSGAFWLKSKGTPAESKSIHAAKKEQAAVPDEAAAATAAPETKPATLNN